MAELICSTVAEKKEASERTAQKCRVLSNTRDYIERNAKLEPAKNMNWKKH